VFCEDTSRSGKGRPPSALLLGGHLGRRRREEFCEDTSLFSDHLGEARTKFVGGLNITSREGFGLPPSALLLGGNLYIALDWESEQVDE
jgi:hypothetical protein